MLLTVLFVFSFSITFSQENQPISSLKGKELHNTIRLNYMQLQMPIDLFPNRASTMGLVGLHYQTPITNWLYGGAGMYFAVTGDQGGLFTLGAELGVQKKIYKQLFFDANFHFGGGGGFRSLVNSGGFINTNMGLKYKQQNFNFGIQYSYFNFYTGTVKSNATSFFIEIPSVIRYTDYKNAQKSFIKNNKNNSSFWSKPAVKNSQQIRFNFLFPIGNSKIYDLSPLTNTLAILSFEYQKYLQENIFAFVHSGAIYKGLRAGYMDLFFGLGYVPYQNKYLNLFTKLGIGAAGGRIAPEGGLTIYPSAGIDIKLTKTIALNGNIGYYRALQGDFEAYALGFGIKYFGFSGGTQKPFIKKSSFKNFKTQGIRINIQNQTYFNAQKTDAPFIVDLQMIAMQFNIDINHTFYFIGEASFAYDGRSGGYAHGVAGIGINSPLLFNNKIRFHLENVVGVAGGAGVDTGTGIVIRPTLGASYQITNGVSLYISGGKMIAPYGNFNTNNLNIGLSFSLATLSVKK